MEFGILMQCVNYQCSQCNSEVTDNNPDVTIYRFTRYAWVTCPECGETEKVRV